MPLQTIHVLTFANKSERVDLNTIGKIQIWKSRDFQKAQSIIVFIFSGSTHKIGWSMEKSR